MKIVKKRLVSVQTKGKAASSMARRRAACFLYQYKGEGAAAVGYGGEGCRPLPLFAPGETMDRRSLYWIALGLCLTAGHRHYAQEAEAGAFADWARNNSTPGSQFRLAAHAAVHPGKYHFVAGLQGTAGGYAGGLYGAWYAGAGRSLALGGASLELGLRYLRQPFSQLMLEENYAFDLACSLGRFDLMLGNNTRVYRLRRGAAPEYSGGDARIVEPRNLMYALTYRLKPAEHPWNAAISLRNADHFLIQQETNPMLMGRFQHRIGGFFTGYAELWYQSAGLLNIRVNNYGFYLRTGLLWNTGW
jgi:hypothetical protein